MELVQNNRSFEGEQRIYSFESKILKTNQIWNLPAATSSGRPKLSCFVLFSWPDLY